MAKVYLSSLEVIGGTALTHSAPGSRTKARSHFLFLYRAFREYFGLPPLFFTINLAIRGVCAR